METVSKQEGRTVLFVSHNMDSIKKLCTKVIILSKGKIVDYGDTVLMINKYLNVKNDIRKVYKHVSWERDEYGPGGNVVKIKSLSTKNASNQLCKEFSINEDIIVEVEFWILKNGYQVCCLFEFYKKNIQLFQTFNDYIKTPSWGQQINFSTGLYTSRCFLPKKLFDEGTIDINVVIFLPPGDIEGSYQVSHPKRSTGAISFNLNDDYSTNSARGNFPYGWSPYAQIRPDIKWETKKINGKSE